MPQYWMIIERLENWQVDQSSNFSTFGLGSRYKKMADKMQVGDTIITYISSGLSAFSDIRIVKSSEVKPMRRSSEYDTSFDYFIITAPHLVLERNLWLPLKSVLSQMDLTRERAEWRQMFRTSLRLLSEHDGALLTQQLELRRAPS